MMAREEAERPLAEKLVHPCRWMPTIDRRGAPKQHAELRALQERLSEPESRFRVGSRAASACQSKSPRRRRMSLAPELFDHRTGNPPGKGLPTLAHWRRAAT